MEEMMEEKSFKKELFSWFIALVLGVTIALICREYVFSPVVVKGASMSPTYESEDVIIVTKLSKIQRFDHIVFEAPNKKEYYIKRVIGLPGDSVEMKDDVLIINGEEFAEPYVNREFDYPIRFTENFTLEELTGEKTVPEGFIFVLGDNRLKSYDSRHYGLIPFEDVYGESKMRIYPLEGFKLFFNSVE